MSNGQEIEHAVSRLYSADLTVFRAWFAEFDAEVWDRQFEEDIAAGRLDSLAERALKYFSAGRCSDLWTSCNAQFLLLLSAATDRNLRFSRSMLLITKAGLSASFTPFQESNSILVCPNRNSLSRACRKKRQ